MKLYIKVAAALLYLIYLLYKKVPFNRPTSLQWFYLAIAGVGICSSVINDSFYQPQYSFGFYFGLLQWIIAFAISYLLFVTITVSKPDVILKTVKVFFGVNAAISLVTLVVLFIQVGFHVPYWLVTNMKYGVSTGDYIKGIFNDTSVTNAAINALAAVYFLRHKEFFWATLCTLVMLLCTSNTTVVLMALVLVAILVLNKELSVKKYTAAILFLMLILYPVLTPQNIRYIEVVYEREKKDNYNIGLSKIEEKEFTNIGITYEKDFFAKKTSSPFNSEYLDGQIKASTYYPYKEDVTKPVFTPGYYYLTSKNYKIGLRNSELVNVSGELIAMREKSDKEMEVDNTEMEIKDVPLSPFVVQEALASWYKVPKGKSPLANSNMPGKFFTHIQTLYFLNSNLTNLLFGAGIGNFSSKLAIRMTGLGLQGSFPENSVYISKDFLQYHFYTILYYLSRHAAEHSVLNMPNSTYNQLIGEYGLIGFLVFFVLYVGYLWRKRNASKVGIYIALIMLMFLSVEYWFELLSLAIVFELFFMNEVIKRQAVDEDI